MKISHVFAALALGFLAVLGAGCESSHSGQVTCGTGATPRTCDAATQYCEELFSSGDDGNMRSFDCVNLPQGCSDCACILASDLCMSDLGDGFGDCDDSVNLIAVQCSEAFG